MLCNFSHQQRVFRKSFLNFDDNTPHHNNLRAFIQIRSYIILIGMQIFQLNELFIVALWTTMLVCGGFLVVQMVVKGSISSPSHFGIIFGQVLGVCWLTCFLFVGCRFDNMQSRQEGAFDKQKRLIELKVDANALTNPLNHSHASLGNLSSYAGSNGSPMSSAQRLRYQDSGAHLELSAPDLSREIKENRKQIERIVKYHSKSWFFPALFQKRFSCAREQSICWKKLTQQKTQFDTKICILGFLASR